MSSERELFEYQVCYGINDRVTFSNGTWLGNDIPESQRKQEDILACPLMWEFLADAGADGWELVSVLESSAGKQVPVRTYYLKRRVLD